MSVSELTIDFLRFLSDEGVEGGGISPLVKIALLLLGVMLLILVVYWLLRAILYGARRRLGEGPAFVRTGAGTRSGEYADRGSAVMGRLEKMERTLNEFKSEVLRAQHLQSAELERISRALNVAAAEKREEGKNIAAERVDVEKREIPPSTSLRLPVDENKEPQRLGERLTPTRQGLLGRLKRVFGERSQLSEEMFDGLEEMLIESDMGIQTAAALMLEVKSEIGKGGRINEQAVIDLLRNKVLEVFRERAVTDSEIQPTPGATTPFVVLLVGVNGVGKTTTAAKLANRWRDSGFSVMLAAADTFRAAAVEQLQRWGEKTGVPVVSGAEGAKPATVVFEAMERAQAEGVQVLIVDTAGRLHTKSNLLQELEGVRNVIRKHDGQAPHQTLLVLDGSTGQNAVNQARQFNAAIPISGLVVTKLDGTPKGGVVVAIASELGIPVRYIGVGEGQNDLRPFVSEEFVEALFASGDIPAGEVSASAEGGSDGKREKREKRTTTWSI